MTDLPLLVMVRFLTSKIVSVFTLPTCLRRGMQA